MLPLKELFSASNIAEYWNNLPQTEAPYLGSDPTMFPARKQIGTKMEWVKGAQGAPVALRLSAFDTNAIPRSFKGFTRQQADMAYYKESWYVDEETRQQILLLMSGSNPAFLDAVTQHVYDQPTSLIRGGLVASEIARMQLLTTGKIHITGNGDAYDIDYGMPSNHKAKAIAPWSDVDNAKPMEDFKQAKDVIQHDQGKNLTRMVMNQTTFNKLAVIKEIKERLAPTTSRAEAFPVLDSEVTQFFQTAFGLSIAVYDKYYQDLSGSHKFIPDDTIVFMPDGPLGSTGYGTTPAEADLMAGQTDVTNVSVVNTGIAIVEKVESDPVQIGGIVSQLSMPSFEQADSVYILDVSGDAAKK